MLLIKKELILNIFIKYENGVDGKMVFGNAVSFENILSPDIGKNATLAWGEKTLTLVNSHGDEKIPIVLGSNIPLGRDMSNDEDFLSIYKNHSYAKMLAHFNCKKSEQTCIQLKSQNPMFSICLIVASVDGFDHVSINSSLTRWRTNMTTWKTDWVGKFSNSQPTTGRILAKNDSNSISLGCFEESSRNNLNYIIMHPTRPLDTIQICYKSYSEISEYVLYSLVECADTETSSFAISGYIFYDKYYSSSRTNNLPADNTEVYIKPVNGHSLIYNLEGKIVSSTKTNANGFYYFDNIPSGDYQVFLKLPDGTKYSPVSDEAQEDPYTNKADSEGIITTFIFLNASGVVPVSKTLPDDMHLTSAYVIREMNIGILPPNITLTGKIFIDYNANGQMDTTPSNTSAIDVPFPYITVILKDGDRVVATIKTDADGNINFANVPLIPTGYMVYVETPNGFVMTNYPFPPAPPAGAPIDLIISQDEPLLIGLISNPLYCQDAPQLAIICYAIQNHNESHSDDPVLISFPSNVTKHLYNSPEGTVTHLATHGEIGSVYGLGYDRKTGDIYTSAFMKYFSGFGPRGTGAIYKTHTVGSKARTSELFFDLNQVKGDPQYCGSDPHIYPMENFDNGVESVGKISFGDLDILNGSIYTIALASRELLKISINNPSVYTLSNIYNPCIGFQDDWRPFALGVRHGSIIIGGVCTMESSPTGTPVGYVMEENGNILLRIPFDFPRGCKSFGGAFCIPGEYSPWSSIYFDSQPWISDLTMDGEDMIISVRDRGGDLDRDVGTYDILRACYNGDQLILENGGVCGGVNGAHLLPSGYFGTPDGINGGEFYNDNFFFPRDNNGHDNVASTAGVVIPGYTTLFGSSLDIDFVGQGTVKVWDNLSGNLMYGIGVYIQNNDNPTNNFGKANGLGDMEAMCMLDF
ncbi:hypothetical protein DICPUDRAFT_97485 [Dictyostelium purpureum]|uniref:SD-repeat containing protein B domain-containing protein n=1 Tax=Dictyostelium purpureum TaxID=5786 RepID=F0ZH23_DICPU|nr:uncharacterized protein DICPUDRAFT_97485 [Dictyostelium purpureum]EGC36757.1 hypothetical protein DICPUDRAFT_97485 [Dictyostelium purpureum]|eukprot:XP_003286703.1 hypothetical protein DICPUDRAFT_97485 [Dictyostelium purpureum]